MNNATVQQAINAILGHVHSQTDRLSDAFIINVIEDLARSLCPDDNYSSEKKTQAPTAVKFGSPADLTERAISEALKVFREATGETGVPSISATVLARIMRDMGQAVTKATEDGLRNVKRRNACPLPQGYSVRLGTDACLPVKLRPVMIPDDDGQWISTFDVEHLLQSFDITVTKRGK